MRKLPLLFTLLLFMLGCAPELIISEKPKEEQGKITDNIHDFKLGSKDSVWLEEEK